MVKPQANTGNLNTSKNVVIISVQTNNTRFSSVRLPLPTRIVVRKLNLPTRLDTPAMCSLKIVRSTAAP
jgi:hypothetical protein